MSNQNFTAARRGLGQCSMCKVHKVNTTKLNSSSACACPEAVPFSQRLSGESSPGFETKTVKCERQEC